MAKSSCKSWLQSTWRCLSCDVMAQLLAILRFPSWPSALESVAMSSYLSNHVMNHPKIKVIPHPEVTCINGESRVESIEARNALTGETGTIHCPALFIFIGAQPHTAWLLKSVLLGDKGFVLTGSAFYTDPSLRLHWSLDRTPCDLETTVPGILAGGDVRAATTKRCGFAVGDGSLAVSCVHRLLA